MRILFDTRIKWTTTVADLGDDFRRYYAAPSPHLIVLVLHEKVVEAVQDVPYGLHRKTFDCNISNHEADARSGYTLPQFAGYQHTKITLRSVTDKLHEATLSEVMADAPTETKAGNYIEPTDMKAFVVEVPPLLVKRVNELLPKHKMTMSCLFWQLLQDFVEDQ